MVVIWSIFLQALVAVGAEKLLSFGLGFILLLVYILLALEGAAFILVANGAKKLLMLETG